MVFVLIAVLASLVVCVFTVISMITKHQLVTPHKKLPGPTPHLLYGNALEMAREPDQLVQQLMEWVNENPAVGILCIWLGPMYPFVVAYKPEFIEVIVGSTKHTTKSSEYQFLQPWLGEGLLTSDGSKWKTRRRLITPTFHFMILNDFIQVFEQQAAVLVTKLEDKCGNGVFNILPYIIRCTLDIICISSMDSSPNVQEKSDSPYFKAVLRMSELVHKRQTCPWLWPEIIFSWTSSGREHDECVKVLHDFTNKVIDERIAERAAKYSGQKEDLKEETNKEDGVTRRKKRSAFLDILLEAYDSGDISREGVREEVDTFMFEGHDTTAAGISWCLYLLGCHPSIQTQVREEVDNFFVQRPERLTVDDLRELRYLECVIKEAQRLFPSVPFFARTTTEDFYLDTYLIPKGTTVGVSTMGTHRNPDVWPSPSDFNPDRFLPENSLGRHPYAFIPFSAGPRNCIGQRFAVLEEKIILGYILRHFTVKSTQSFDDLRTCAELVTRPKEGIFLSLEHRF